MANNVTVKQNQSLFDIALQTVGNPESVFDIAINNNISITDNLTEGRLLIIDGYIPTSIALYYSVNGIVPATAIKDTDIANTILGEGIEFWDIETDFIVN